MDAARTIGEYRILRLLGKGGMSEVYEAEHVRLGSRHAVKFFTYGQENDGVRERFLAEGRLLARLSHPRIVRVTDIGGEDGAQPYFVMDLISDGAGNVRSLADVSAGGADEAQIAMWYDDLRDGLSYIHAKGVVHRDLKLENVLIGPDGHVVLTDFGISKIAKAEDGGKEVIDPVQTIVQMKDGKVPVMGSVGYLAPELEMGVAASPQSDYYALGVIVFRLLTGMWCDSRTDVVGALDTYDPTWRQILPKLLHANPRGRECLSWRELKALDEPEPVAARAPDTTRRVLAAAGISAAVACAVTATIFGAALLRMAPPPPLPVFGDVVAVPADAPEEDSDERLARERFQAALPDAWLLTHGIFDDLKAGGITLEKAVAEMEQLSRRAVQDNLALFDPYPFYTPSGEDEALAELLEAAVARMRGWPAK